MGLDGHSTWQVCVGGSCRQLCKELIAPCPFSELQVVDMICKLAKKGMTPSQIGVVLRDSHGIPLVTNVTGNKILRILRVSIPHNCICSDRHRAFSLQPYAALSVCKLSSPLCNLTSPAT